jgi:inhibitor of KinA sporulation pathway (predicted exonuclease)
MRDQNYFALDLELNNKNDGSVPRIIEVGVAIGNPLRPEEIKKLNWYLDPQEPITPFISGLTGITDNVIAEKAVPHAQVAKELGALIDVYNCFPNPVTWGQGDAQELRNEFQERGVEFRYFGRRILDVKTIFVFHQIAQGKTPSGGLKKSIGAAGLKFEGQPHRAADDSYNTLRFFFHLLFREQEIRSHISALSTIYT